MLKKLRYYFVAGTLIILPVFASVWILSWLFVSLTNFITRLLPQYSRNTAEIRILWRIVALLLLFSVITVVGFLAKVYIGRKLFHFGESILVRIPVFRKIYMAVKQLLEAFIGDKRTIMRSVGLIEYPRHGLYTIVFVTSETFEQIQDKTAQEVVNVFVPTTPNPTSGFFLMVPKKDLVRLDMTVEDGLKLVISGGAVKPLIRPGFGALPQGGQEGPKGHA